MAMSHNWELSTLNALQSHRVLLAGSLELVGPKGSLKLAGCVFCFTSVKGLRSIMSHEHGTS